MDSNSWLLLFLGLSIFILFVLVIVLYTRIPPGYSDNVTLSLNFQDFDGEILDEENNLLKNLTNVDVMAFQNLSIPNSRWINPQSGSVEYMGPSLGKQFQILISRSVQDTVMDSQLSYGLYINPNLNLQFAKEDIISFSSSNYGAIGVYGKLFNKYSILLLNLSGVPDNPESNIEIVNNIVSYIVQKKPDIYLLFGDFQINFSDMKNSVTTWKKKLHNLNWEIDTGIDGSLVSHINTPGYSQTTHIITNLIINDFSLYNCFSKNNLCLSSSILINQKSVPKFNPDNVKIYKTNNNILR